MRVVVFASKIELARYGASDLIVAVWVNGKCCNHSTAISVLIIYADTVGLPLPDSVPVLYQLDDRPTSTKSPPLQTNN